MNDKDQTTSELTTKFWYQRQRLYICKVIKKKKTAWDIIV